MTFFDDIPQRGTTTFPNGRPNMQPRVTSLLASLLPLALAAVSFAQANPPASAAQLKTPPKTWVDKDTGHRVTRLTDELGSKGLYFDENAYTPDGLDMVYTSPKGIHDLNLATLKSNLLVSGRVGAVIVGTKTRRVFYENRTDGRYYVIDIDTRKVTKLPIVNLAGHVYISTVNADETLLAGTFIEGKAPEFNKYRLDAISSVKPAFDQIGQTSAEINTTTTVAGRSLGETIEALNQARAGSTTALGVAKSKLNEAQSQQAVADALTADTNAKMADAQAQLKQANANAVQKRFDAREPEDLFTLNLQTGEVKIILKGTDWLNHVKFSPTDPTLLLYDHEGPALQVDRVWTIRADGAHNVLMQNRSDPAGIATHEFWSHDGKTVWFDLQESKGQDFAVAGVDVATGNRTTYRLKKEEASIHYNLSPDGKVFCGDGNLMTHGEIGVNGHRTLDRAWIELLRPSPDGTFHSTRLAHLADNNYELTEPNPRFSPDKKMVIFTSNMLGHNYIFAVDVAKAPPTTTVAAQ